MATEYMPASTPASQRELADASEVVDDLIKFRLVDAMLASPDELSSAAALAERLGFHSVEVTGMALDELVSDGVLRAQRRHSDIEYQLAPDQTLRAELSRLVSRRPPSVINRLSAASVARVKRLLRKKS